MARTHRKYSSVRNRNDRHDKINDAINAECEFEEQLTGYKISGKKRWNRQHSPDFDTDEWWDPARGLVTQYSIEYTY